MKAIVPEIAWHNKSPVFSVHIQPELNKNFYRAATGGGDSHIVIWHLVIKEVENETTVSVDFAADLDRHIKAVNVVRFSNDSKLLASGDDDAVIIIWALKEDQNNCNNNSNNEEGNKENWTSVKVLRGHKDDIYDICWSPLSTEIFSGSVDNTALLWNISKGQTIGKIGEHNGFVQGVSWDSKGKCLATLCSDRALRLFDVETKKLISKVTKAKPNKTSAQEDGDNEDNFMRLFHDDTVKTFFRRLCFSPDGNLVFTPCGIFRDSDCDSKPPKDVTYIFLKSKPERPILHLPSRDEYTVAVRCCPLLFELNPSENNLFSLPYRIVFAIASRRSIVFYDSQQLQPFGVVSDIHYATLTDISWSPDGKMLLASSSDGYCTIVTFKKDELGVLYRGASSDTEMTTLDNGFEDLGVEPIDQSGYQLINGTESDPAHENKSIEEVVSNTSCLKPQRETTKSSPKDCEVLSLGVIDLNNSPQQKTTSLENKSESSNTEVQRINKEDKISDLIPRRKVSNSPKDCKVLTPISDDLFNNFTKQNKVSSEEKSANSNSEVPSVEKNKKISILIPRKKPSNTSPKNSKVHSPVKVNPSTEKMVISEEKSDNSNSEVQPMEVDTPAEEPKVSRHHIVES